MKAGKKKTNEVLQKIQEPSNEKLNTYERIGVASGGALIAFAGFRNLRRGWPLAVIGTAVAISGIAGKNPLYAVNKRSSKQLQVKTSIIINKSKEEVYDFWRNLENLPSFMEHIKEVKTLHDKRSHWTAELQNVEVEWDAEITQDTRGRRIGWQSLPGSDVETTGQVDFRDAPDGNGTELTVVLEYADGSGQLAKSFASLYHPVFKDQVKEELKKCKSILESRKSTQVGPESQGTRAHG